MEVNLQTEYWGRVSYREAWERPCQSSSLREPLGVLRTSACLYVGKAWEGGEYAFK